MSDLGRPKYFSVDKYLDSVEGMIASDEIERAFLMLDNMPAYYRDNVPERAREIRESLHRQLWTPVQYLSVDWGEPDVDGIAAELPGRAVVLRDLIRQLNEKGQVPRLLECAPGNFWLPRCLEHLGLLFNYEHVGLEKPDRGWVVEGSGPSIFVAFEVIEHLSNEFEVYQNYLKFGREAEFVMLSTPFYTYGGGMDDWRSRDLGHLRAYTPAELLAKAQKMFLGRTWQVFGDETIILMGRSNEPA